MLRELAVSLYLFMFTTFFKLSKLFPLQNKVTFVVSFSENNKSVYKEMLRQEFSCRTLFLTTEKMYPLFSKYKDATTLLFELKKPFDFLRSIFHLATSKVIVVDNYYGFLSKSAFKPSVECIQLWHANGAIKKFGLEDPSIETRNKRAMARFKSVYNRFDKVVVGSEAMADVFKQAFGTSDGKILRSGMPRTDVFFDRSAKAKAETKLLRQFPVLKVKKVILYAPTYRENQLLDAELRIDLKSLAAQFADEYVLLLKIHPAVKNKIKIPSELSHFVYDFSSYHQLNDLLFVTDILITDYSSIPFEYCLLNRPIIFFLYDLEEYEKERGIWDDYLTFLPGPIAYSSEEVTTIIKNDQFDLGRIRSFSDKWNQYSHGESSKNIVCLIKEKLNH